MREGEHLRQSEKEKDTERLKSKNNVVLQHLCINHSDKSLSDYL